MRRHLIRGGRVVEDTWTVVVADEKHSPESVPLPGGPVVVGLPVWQARRDEVLGHSHPAGVLLQPADDPFAIAGDLPRVALVAVNFPKFADGRGYSIAYLLRRRLGFRGELRATGDIQRDQIFYLARSGFDAFLLKEGQNPEGALAALRDFSVTYQTAADGRAPRFRRPAATPEAGGMIEPFEAEQWPPGGLAHG